MANVHGPRPAGVPAAAQADAARRARAARAGVAAPRAAAAARGAAAAVPAAAAAAAAAVGGGAQAAGATWLLSAPWATIVACLRFVFYVLSWAWVGGLFQGRRGGQPDAQAARAHFVPGGAAFHGGPFDAGLFDDEALFGFAGGRPPPDPFAPAAAARLAQLRRMQPRQVYAAVADGRFRLEEVVGRYDVDAGIYEPHVLHAHVSQDLVPEALLSGLFRAPSFRRMFLDQVAPSLRVENANGGYDAASCARLAHYPAAALYAMARAELVSMQGVLLGMQPEALRLHANAFALRLDADPFRLRTPAAALRLVDCGLLDAGALHNRWELATFRAAVQRSAGLPAEHRRQIPGCVEASGPRQQAMREGWVLPQAVGEGLGPAQLEAGLDAGTLRFANVADKLTPPSVARVTGLVAAANGSWAEWFVRWPHAEAELRQVLHAGELQPFFLQLGGQNQAVAAALLWQAGRIDDRRAATFAAKHWDGTPQLPVATAQLVRAYPSLARVVRDVPLPVPTVPGGLSVPPTLAQRRRNAGYLALCVATWVDGSTAGAAPAAQQARRQAANAPFERNAQNVSRLFVDQFREQQRAQSQRSIAAAPTAAPAHPAAVECIGCGDEVARHELVVLDRCAHPAQYDRDCFLRGLEIGGGHRCPGTDCQRPLGLRDALQLALPTDRALTLARRAARDALEALAGWARCRTADCLGGRVELQPSRAPIDCRCCGMVAPALRGEVQRYANLGAAERDQVRMLVEFAGVAGVRRGSALRPIRECYHCGMLTEHQEQCMSLDCRPVAGGCGAAWNFVDGQAGRHQFGMGPATYVPRAGWLLDLGLYQGLQPGQTDVDVRPTLARNLARLRNEAA